MPETVFDELKRFVRFGPEDEAALRELAAVASPHFPGIVELFYARLSEHDGAARVLRDPGQVERLKRTLAQWLSLLLRGPWDDAYFEQRARIGRTHVKIGLPQRYMFGAMDVIRLELLALAERQPRREALACALHKILDLELAIMLESYGEAIIGVRTRRSERLAALGTMAAGLAHEIRNPLNAAHLQLNVARRRLSRVATPEGDSARAAVEIAEAEMKRLAGLVEDFLQFARPQPLRLSAADLRSTAEVILALLGPEAAGAGVTLTLSQGPRVPLELDDEKMKQVLINLVRNAIEATGRGGKVTLGVDASAGMAHVTVEDDGGGLPADSPIFEPFFTTKPSGTGLGLAIVHRIVTDHGGTVDVESRPGRTLFAISLPLPGSRAGTPPAPLRA